MKPTAEPGTMPAIDAEAIPDELKALAQWVVWRRVVRDGRATKVPFRADDPEAEASSTDPSTWSTFAGALAASRDPDHRLDGIGFVFTAADPYVGIDLDHCLAADGTGIEPWAREVLEKVPGYAEVTPSGRGLHLITRGVCPGGKGRKRGGLMPAGGAIECYDRGRYFTFTGRVFMGRSEIGDGSAELAAFHAEWFPPRPDRPRVAPEAPASGDAGIVRLALAASNGPKFARLWQGDRSGYPSASEADLALCSLLSFYAPDPAAIDRLFRQSGLRSAKWEGRADYRELTIARALQRAETYSPGHRPANGHVPAAAVPPPREPGDDDPDEGEDPDAWLPPDEEVISVRMSEVERKEVRWLFPDRIPVGKVTLIAGDPGLGKSFLTMDLIARVTTGGPIPAGSGECVPQGPVVLLCAEDDLADTVGPRLDAAGADAAEVHVLTTLVMTGGRREPFSLAYMPHLERVIVRAGAPKLVVIDPVTSYIGGGVDDHKNSSLRSVLGPLAEMAARREVAVVIVTHLNKSSGSKALNRITGSLAYVALARVAWLIVRDPDDPERRLFLSVKNNLAPEPSGLSYRIDRATRRVVWDDAPVLMTANEALQAHNDRDHAEKGERGPRIGRAEEARDFLLGMLAGGREMPHEELVTLARARGISKNAIYEAREAAGVRPRKAGFQGPWFWSIPAADPPGGVDEPIF